MNGSLKKPLFVVFLISGMCGLIYQLVWMRLAMASFGVITPVLSVVISVFMLGLALGSWLGGKYIDRWSQGTGISPLFFYVSAELFIGSGAVIVPKLFVLSQRLLLGAGEANSAMYLGLSALLIAASMLPWCVAMGTTFPFMMSFVRKRCPSESGSFSFLYTANVVGAVAGVLLTTVFFVEMFGFRHTLWFAGLMNLCAAALAYGLRGETRTDTAAGPEPAAPAAADRMSLTLAQVILFATGFTSLGMEVAWTRAFTPVLGTMVYAFSFLLAGYMLATWLGSSLYRRDIARNWSVLQALQDAFVKTILFTIRAAAVLISLVSPDLLAWIKRHASRVMPPLEEGARVKPVPFLVMLLAVFSFLPIVLNDPLLVRHFNRHFGLFSYIILVLFTIFPLCTALGYLTPLLIDTYSGGDPGKAGKSYAFNILGCILGPVFVSYLLLPVLGVKYTLALLAVPYVVFFLMRARSLPVLPRLAGGAVSFLVLVVSFLWSTSYEVPRLADMWVKRDYAATVVCTTVGGNKLLLVNGIGITGLTPITKFMAHLPLAFHPGKPESALVICFGMGTTYRSLLSWDVDTTAVELVPSVRYVFGYFYRDGETLAHSPHGRIFIDDGRRFLMRTPQKFDVITLDPPPPIESSGSSLLYSKEFYDLVKMRLADNGILQQWFPYAPEGGRRALSSLCAAARSLSESFPYVKAYVSVEGWGVHFIASRSPILAPAAAEMVSRMPASARADLMEWAPGADPRAYVSSVLTHEIPMEVLLADGEPGTRITDDRPYNEYFLCRDPQLKSGVAIDWSRYVDKPRKQ